MSSPARSDAVLEAACSRAGITRDGCTWLKWGLNPYSDNPEALAGYPDDCMSDSVPQVVKSSITIACPSSLSNVNWDCHIVSLPFRSPLVVGQWAPTTSTGNPYGNTGFPNGNSFSIAGNGALVGGLQIMAGASGTAFSLDSANNWSPSSGFTGGSSYSVYQCPDPTFTTGTCRIIGSGWEVHNTTAELNVQGTVTVYRQPVPNQTMVSNACVWTSSPPNVILTQNYPLVLYTPHPPLSIKDAMLYPNSKQWKAKDGVYAVDMLHDTDIKPQGPYFTQPCFIKSGTGVSTAYLGTLPSSTAVAMSATNQPVNWPDAFWTQFEQTGAWFTGLSPTTTLTINTLTVIERFPTIGDDPNLLVVATPSAMEDKLALQVYADTIRKLPIAVPVRENAFGDWIKNAASTVYKVVAPLIRASGHPMLNAALTGGEAIYALGKNSKGGGKTRKSAAQKQLAPAPKGKVAPGNSWVESNTSSRALSAAWKDATSAPTDDELWGTGKRKRKRNRKRKAGAAIPRAPPLTVAPAKVRQRFGGGGGRMPKATVLRAAKQLLSSASLPRRAGGGPGPARGARRIGRGGRRS